MNLIKQAKHIHFVGIGGIGVSALARMMHAQGKQVSGSDSVATNLTSTLANEEMTIFDTHASEHITDDVDVVVYSPAVPHDNPELEEARKKKIPLFTYPQALGQASEHAFTIAVAGTHGKTTTTAMLAHVLKDTLNPTVIVGSLLKETRSNFVSGSSDYFLVEACEYKRSFLNLSPDILVITNVEEDHLDYYKNLEDIQHAFNELVRKVPADGYVVCDIESETVKPVLRGVQATVRNYRAFLDHTLTLQVPGEHNKQNAAAAHAVADIFALPDAEVDHALGGFTGTWRRFEQKGMTENGTRVYDDYAHNPAEISATLSAAREAFGDTRLVVVFQPHLYSRTKYFLGDFAESFAKADEVIVVPIYAAREEDDGTISHHDVVRSLEQQRIHAVECDSLDAAYTYLKQNLTGDEVVMTMGAGDVYTVGERLLEKVS